MKHLAFVLAAAAIVPLGTWAQGSAARDKADWERVERLKQGDEITVVSGKTGGYRCNFSGATETDLYCIVFAPRPAPLLIPFPMPQISDRELRFSRQEIVKVRHRHLKRDQYLTAAVATGLGCWISADTAGPYGCVIFGPLFGAVGYLVGTMVFIWFPGNTIYENPEAKHWKFGQQALTTPKSGSPQ